MAVQIDDKKIMVAGYVAMITVIGYFLSQFHWSMNELVDTVKEIQIHQAEQRGQIFGRFDNHTTRIEALEKEISELKKESKHREKQITEYFAEYGGALDWAKTESRK